MDIERRRPAPEAVVRLAEVGLVPVRTSLDSIRPDVAALPYLPPERIDGGAMDSRGDIYGLGATLYFLLTGRPPFLGDDAAQILNAGPRWGTVHARRPCDPICPAELIGLVARMMDKEPDRRPPRPSTWRRS